jgi:hypothetical protein
MTPKRHIAKLKRDANTVAAIEDFRRKQGISVQDFGTLLQTMNACPWREVEACAKQTGKAWHQYSTQVETRDACGIDSKDRHMG